MIGVQFTTSMAPYSKGDRVMLPEDVAQKIVDSGEGELVEMPERPHAQQFGEKPAPKAIKGRPSPTKKPFNRPEKSLI